MGPRERRETGKQDLFRSRLDQIIDLNHALVKLARTVNWRFLEDRFGAIYTDGPGQPPLPMAALIGNTIERLIADAGYRRLRQILWRLFETLQLNPA